MKRCLMQAQFVAVAILLAGCGDDSSSGGGSGPGAGNLLVKSSVAPADAQCAAGGTKLEFGTDKNGNGTLDADEVTSTQTVCGQAPTLTTVTPTGASDKCKNGGTTVKSGPDTNGNGKLDDNEVKDTQEICTGGSSATLATTTTLAEGDINCPFGGVKTESGQDNGAGGATAGDGVLAASEITSTKYTCVTSNTPFAGSLVPPAGAAGTNKYLAGGGAGSVNAGGSGGPIQIGTGLFGGQGTGGGHLKIWKAGTVDASFTMAAQTPVFGATKMEVAANKTIATYANNASGQVDGEYYTINNNGLFFRQNAGNPQVTVTGVHVAAGVTLTFPMNGINFSMNDDFHNEGTITSALNGANRGSVQMTVAKYISTTASKVTLTGANGTAAAGGSGGAFIVIGDGIYNAGAVDTSGGTGDVGFNGGNAAPIQLAAQRQTGSGPVQNTADLKAVGGAGKASGGTGNIVALIANTHGVYHKGAIDASGGGGGTGSGGPSQQILLQAQAGGKVIASGTMTTKGGDIDEAACVATCQGGTANQAALVSVGSDVIASVQHVNTGGKSKGTAGGAGGPVIYVTQDGSDPFIGAQRPAGSIRQFGSIDTRGGAGATGGPANAIILTTITNQPVGQEIELFGVDALDTSGGNGITGGGTGGSIILRNSASPGNTATGSVIVQSTLTTKGGNTSTSGNGGSGGQVQLWTGNGNVTFGTATKSQTVLVGGNVDTSGGNGVAAGGTSGPIDIRGREHVDVFGTILSAGGNTSANGAGAGFGNSVLIQSSGLITSNAGATITVKGGNATGTAAIGGGTATVNVTGGAIKLGAAVTITGGNGNGATGGPANTLNIAGSTAPSIVGAATALGGTGTPNGANGQVTIDGNVQP